MSPPTNQITVLPNPAVKDNNTDSPNVPPYVKRTSHNHLKFGVTGSRQLSLQVYDTTNITNPTQFADNGSSLGYIHEPGTLASTIQNNIAVVYGIASSGASEKSATGICKLSPYYNPLLKSNEKDAGIVTTNLWSLAACDDGIAGNWVYFLRNEGDDKNPKVVLVQLEVDPLDQARETVLDLNYTVGAGSRLASIYGGSPYVFYVRDVEGEIGIYFVDATSPNSAQPIHDTATVKTKSPLAVVMNPSTNDSNDIILQITLYFVNINGYLSYVLGTLEEGYIRWNKVHQSLENFKVDQTSSLAVLSGADNKTHYIYFVPKGGNAGGYVVKTATPWQRPPVPPS